MDLTSWTKRSNRQFVVRWLVLTIVANSALFIGTNAIGSQSFPGTLWVDPSNNSKALIPQILQAGYSYRFIVTGTFTYEWQGSRYMADAECTGYSADPTTDSTGSPKQYQKDYPIGDHLDLYVNDAAVDWIPINKGQLAQAQGQSASVPECSDDHSYYVEHLATRTGRASFVVSDTTYDDNYGKNTEDVKTGLFVSLVCVIPYPGPAFITTSSFNRRLSETAAATSDCPQGLDYTSLSYQCPKDRFEPANQPRKDNVFGILQSAKLTVDSRENLFDPVLKSDPGYANRKYATQTGNYYDPDGAPLEAKQTGHWGMQTCNWAGEGVSYRIVVTGTYRYDQTVPPSTTYAMADAECATGYPPSSSNVKDHLGNDAQVESKPSGSLVNDIQDEDKRSTQTVIDRLRQGLAPLVETRPSPSKSTVLWEYQFMPAHYRYFLDGLQRGKFLDPGKTFPADDLLPATRDYLDAHVRQTTNPRGFAQVIKLDPISDSEETPKPEWEDNRFQYTVTHAASSNTIEPGERKVDSFDLSIGWGAGTKNFVEWKPLELDIQGKLVPKTDSRCSPIHSYYYDVDWSKADNPLIANTPFHFSIQDVVPYHEWDNCGMLSVRIGIRTNDNYFPVPDSPSFGPQSCHYVPAPISTLVRIRDLRIEEGDPFRSNSAHAYYFDPTSTVINELQFFPGADAPDLCRTYPQNICPADVQSKATAPNVVVWQNWGFGPHSITSAIDENGKFCENVVTFPQPLAKVDPNNPQGASVNGERPRIQAGPLTVEVDGPVNLPRIIGSDRFIGTDDCDKEPPRIKPDGTKSWRLFDSHPYCLASLDKTSNAVYPISRDLCTSPQQNFSWTVDLSGIKQNPDVCTSEYCTIPYFCRVAPDTMRGTLVIRRG